MKKLFLIIPILFISLSCDKNFEEINTNPNASTDINPELLFSTALLQAAGNKFQCEGAMLLNASCYVQHIATTAFNWRGDKYFYSPFENDVMFSDGFRNEVKTIVDMLEKVKDDPEKTNLYAVGRIWKVYIFHRLTDLYGDLPYFEAGRGYLDYNFEPTYDKQQDIYMDMLSELEVATNALDESKPFIEDQDFVYGGKLGKWQRFGNSLMLRLAMRLVKADPTAAETWAKKAIDGGLMWSTDDSAFIGHNWSEGIIQNGMAQIFEDEDNSARLSRAFVNFLKETYDPRLYIFGTIADTLEHKGMPNGWDSGMLFDSTGLTNMETFTRVNADLVRRWTPSIYLGYAETELLLAEATVRNWVSGDATEHYEKGVRAAMQQLTSFAPWFIIDDYTIDNFLNNNPFNPEDDEAALEMINTQYWVATFLNELESYANWRRSGFPVLTPSNYPGNDTGGTIPRRFRYPQVEYSVNSENINAAVNRQGPDLLTTRVWWDAQ